MRFIYTIVITCLLPFAFIRLFVLGFKNVGYRERWYERLGFVPTIDNNQPVIWLHAVSVGEMNAATPLINQLRQTHPDHQVVVTTVTPTGADTLRKHFGNEIPHFYLPYDLPSIQRRFLKRIRPDIVLIMETEIWPNLFEACFSNNIPLVLINARLSSKSAARYRRLARLTKTTLMKLSMIAAQTENDARRFIELGMPDEKIHVMGNMKFDMPVPQSVSEQSEVLKRYFSMNRPVWMAASTQEGEEEIILDAHSVILQQQPGAILILAPRHPERCGKVASLCRERGLTVIRKTDNKPFKDSDQVFLLDTLGELQAHYAASEVAFVGGSLVNRGGQNMLEPASIGLPVLTGPHTYNFQEVSRLLKESGGLNIVNSSDNLAEWVCRFFSDANMRHDLGDKARQVVLSHKGIAGKVADLLRPYINTATYCRNDI